LNGIKTIEHDNDGKQSPTVLKLGSFTFFVIKRMNKFGIRIKDSNNPERLNFRGLEYFPWNEKWTFEAKFEPYLPPKILPIKNVFDMDAPEVSPGALVFQFEGQEYRLDTIDETTELFIPFKDLTNGKETYGMRFLETPLPVNNRVLVDFNRSYNPPCCFTDFATCPVPHKQNILPIPIHAGELKYGDH